jgi:hypothetical protein
MKRCDKPALVMSKSAFQACREHAKGEEFCWQLLDEEGKCDAPIETKEQFFARIKREEIAEQRKLEALFS